MTDATDGTSVESALCATWMSVGLYVGRRRGRPRMSNAGEVRRYVQGVNGSACLHLRNTCVCCLAVAGAGGVRPRGWSTI